MMWMLYGEAREAMEKNSFYCEAIMEDRRADVKLQNVDSPQADRSHLKIVMFI